MRIDSPLPHVTRPGLRTRRLASHGGLFSHFAQQSKRNGIQGKRLARLTFAAALRRMALCDLQAAALVRRPAAASAASTTLVETAAHASISNAPRSPRATCDLAFNSHRVKAPDQRSTSLLRSLSSAFPSRPLKPLTPSATPMQPPFRSRPFRWCSRAATLSPPQKPARAKPLRSRFLPWTSWAIAKATTAVPSCSS